MPHLGKITTIGRQAKPDEWRTAPKQWRLPAIDPEVGYAL